MTDLTSIRALVYGYVQGVFFRSFVYKQAIELGLTGYVCNLPTGEVEIKAEGDRNKLEKLIDHLKVGPPKAMVEKVAASWSKYTGVYSEFSIR